MRRGSMITGIPPMLTFLVVFHVAGCKSLFKSEGLPQHPLFEHRKPVEAKAGEKIALPRTSSEPIPPQNPYYEAYRANVARQFERATPGTLTNRPK